MELEHTINTVHLHVHSHFSLLAGTASPAELAAQAAAEGMRYLALTDSHALYGAIPFQDACLQAGVQPIIGMLVNVAPPSQLARGPGALILLASNPAGYRSLCRLSTFFQGNANRERLIAAGVDWETLKTCTDGLICLDGGRIGCLVPALARGEQRAALRMAGKLAGIFGEDNTFLGLEIQHQADTERCQAITELAKRLGLGTVAVHPIHCLAAQETARLRLLTAIAHNCPLATLPDHLLPGRDRNTDVHWLSKAEMAQRYAAFPAALAETGAIAARCQPSLPQGEPVWPAVDLAAGQTDDQALADLANDGLLARYGASPAEAVVQRLNKELDAITRHNYAPLFLVVADLVRYARTNDIPVSTRGSVANSLVAFCSGISDVDPIAHDLLFERFLNPARSDPPDIDLDLCSRRRDKVLAYARDRYGHDRFALVGTISTMQPRSAVREAAKAYGLQEDAIQHLLACLPRGRHRGPSQADENQLQQALDNIENPRWREIVRAGYALVGQPHHLSIHAGGVTITPGPLTNWVPLQWTPKGFLTTQYDHHNIERIGLAKIDLLGIRALTVLAETAELIRQHDAPTFRLSNIPATDRATGDLLASGETIGVFQCESAGAQRTLRQLQARNTRDLAIANAFFKPGPSTGGMAQTFVRRYRGEEAVSYLHPALAPILGPTKGVLIFQEQVLRVACQVAGLDWAQANQLRRGMSKFLPAEMTALQAAFIDGCQRPSPAGPDLTGEQAATLWEQVLAFAGYGFNQGHATAYASVSYRSAFLKTYWPAAFLCARLAHHGGYHHPAIYMAEARRLGIEVKPPHINYSNSRFTLGLETESRRPCLWMGLNQVRDLRQVTLAAIITERQLRPFQGLRDLLSRVPLQRKELIHLIQCGALDGLDENRRSLLIEAAEIDRAGNIQQLALPFARPAIEPETVVQRLTWETQLLGLPVSALAPWRDLPAGATAIKELPASGGKQVTILGVRLPGWTGGKGFFVADQDCFVTVRGAGEKNPPPPWHPLILTGRWRCDEWGTCWFQANSIRPVATGPDGERANRGTQARTR